MENKKYRVLGFVSLFYGKEYFRESLLSIRDHCDKVYICHTQTPSHGHSTTEKCPDTAQELLTIADEVLGPKLIWESYQGFQNEAAHRDQRYRHSEGMDIILTIDPDEVFEGVPAALDFAFENKERFFGLSGYINLWRSFQFCNRDSFRPIRIENLRNTGYAQNHECKLTVYHFSTAQSEECLRFKMKVFGHASEVGDKYLDEKYYAWTPENRVQFLHPASQDIWKDAQDFDKTVMPDNLKKHKNYDAYLI